jgi:hypothetical protein
VLWRWPSTAARHAEALTRALRRVAAQDKRFVSLLASRIHPCRHRTALRTDPSRGPIREGAPGVASAKLPDVPLACVGGVLTWRCNARRMATGNLGLLPSQLGLEARQQAVRPILTAAKSFEAAATMRRRMNERREYRRSLASRGRATFETAMDWGSFACVVRDQQRRGALDVTCERITGGSRAPQSAGRIMGQTTPNGSLGHRVAGLFCRAGEAWLPWMPRHELRR